MIMMTIEAHEEIVRALNIKNEKLRKALNTAAEKLGSCSEHMASRDCYIVLHDVSDTPDDEAQFLKECKL